MKFFEILGKIARIRFYAIAILVGILFTVIGAVILSRPAPETAQVDGVIVEIEETYDFDDNNAYIVYVDYTDLDGNTHEHIDYHSYSTGMQVGDTVPVVYQVEHPELVSSPGAEFIVYIILGAGILVLIVSFVMIIRAVKSVATGESQFDCVNVTPDEETLAAIRDNDEPSVEYYFHWCGKLNQSYILETPNRRPVYEAKCDRIGVFRPYIYTFVDHRTGKSETKTVTHTRTTRYGSDDTPFGSWSVPTSSAFRIDDESCWSILGARGYSLEMRLEGIRLNFDVLRYGIRIGSLEAAGVNVAKEGADYKLGDKLPADGVYRVFCKDSDLETVFFAAFCASRVEFT